MYNIPLSGKFKSIYLLFPNGSEESVEVSDKILIPEDKEVRLEPVLARTMMFITEVTIFSGEREGQCEYR
jgi:hypothetical protein